MLSATSPHNLDWQQASAFRRGFGSGKFVRTNAGETLVQRSLLFAALLALATCGSARGWQGWPAMEASFENPPLKYEGPDPTANFYMPASTATSNWNTAPADVPTGDEAAELLPPLMPYSNQMPPMFADGAMYATPPACGITDYKDGFFQKLSISETYLDRNNRDDYGLHEIDVYATFAVPAPTREWPMLISPTFNTRLVDGPVAPDLPPRLYEAYVDFMWLPRFTPRFMGIVSAAPGVYTDFHTSGDDAFRLTGKGLVRFDWIPDRLQIIGGVLYLNRNDIEILPAGGVIWMPDDARRYELLFPKPKLAHRIIIGPNYEDWIFLGGEFGGNTYAIERVGGATDFVTLRDLRVYVGLERKKPGGAGRHIEIGYVFDRSAEYESGTPDAEPNDTAILRGGFTF